MSQVGLSANVGKQALPTHRRVANGRHLHNRGLATAPDLCRLYATASEVYRTEVREFESPGALESQQYGAFSVTAPRNLDREGVSNGSHEERGAPSAAAARARETVGCANFR